jgi:hypothetical protein
MFFLKVGGGHLKIHYLTFALGIVLFASAARCEEKAARAETTANDAAFAQPKGGNRTAAAAVDNTSDPEERYRVAFEAFLKAKQSMASAEQELAEAKARLESFRQNVGIRQQIQQLLDESGKKTMSDDEKRRLQEKISRLIEQLK